MGRVLCINGVSVAMDETARGGQRKAGSCLAAPAREVRALAADNGPTSTVLPFQVCNRLVSTKLRVACDGRLRTDAWRVLSRDVSHRDCAQQQSRCSSRRIASVWAARSQRRRLGERTSAGWSQAIAWVRLDSRGSRRAPRHYRSLECVREAVGGNVAVRVTSGTAIYSGGYWW
jgi:hypothetical protein